MPQLFSRMDDMNWLTPSIADILDQGAAPPGGDGTIREQTLLLQQKLAELETPVRILNVRNTPSYMLFIARPESIGRLGNRRPVTAAEIRRSIGQIAEENRTWRLGFLPQIQDNPDTIGILLRTDEHQALGLRRVLVRSSFRDHPSTLAFTLGNTLEQQLIVQDLADIGHVLVAGADNTRMQFVRATLLTLIALNTPSELRLALTGRNAELYKGFVNAPHTLGRILTMPEDAQRLFDGLVKELGRRQQWFKDEGVETISAYNSVLTRQGKPPLPRILLVVDSLSEAEWQAASDTWSASLSALLSGGNSIGIHLIITANQAQAPDVPAGLSPLFPLIIVHRSAAAGLLDQVKNFHQSLLRFVDAFVVSGADILPLELCLVSDQEIENTVGYWKQASQQRKQDTSPLTPISGRTGLTGMLEPSAALAVLDSTAPPPTPPVPEKPSAEALSRATQALSRAIPEARPQVSFHQVQALAAYLGWIGVGPLVDIFEMSVDEAQKTLLVLRTMGIVEDTSTSTPRFIRLISAPRE